MRPLAAHILPGSAAAPGSSQVASAALSGNHELLHEGTRLGLIVASVTWVWLVVIDMIVGQPFHAFNALGGVVVFTMVHLALNLVYGIALVWAVHGAATENSIAIGLIFGAIMVEVAFALVTTLLSNLVLGNLAWLEIFVGSLIGTTLAIVLLARSHPLLAQLQRAEAEG